MTACKSNRCKQGQKACPTVAACNLRCNPFNIHPTESGKKADAIVVILMWLVLTAVMASLAMAAGYFLYPF